MLKFSIAFALSKLKVRGYRGLLPEEGRNLIADDVVRQFKEYRGPVETRQGNYSTGTWTRGGFL